MLTIHIIVNKQIIPIEIDEHATFLDFIMKVQHAWGKSLAHVEQDDLFALAQYRGPDGTLYGLEHLDISLQQLGFYDQMKLQISNETLLERSHQDLSIENLRGRMGDIILGSLAREIANSPAGSSESDMPRTSALLTQCYQYHLLSRTQTQSIITHMQSRYPDEIIPPDSPEYTIYTRLNSIVASPNRESKEPPPEEKEKNADEEGAKVLAELRETAFPSVLGYLMSDYTDVYYENQAERLLRLPLPTNWDELSAEGKNIFLEKYLPGEHKLQQLAHKLPQIRKMPAKYAMTADRLMFKLSYKCHIDFDAKYGADSDARTFYYRDMLPVAFQHGHLAIVEEILTNSAFIPNAENLVKALRVVGERNDFRLVELVLAQLISLSRQPGIHLAIAPYINDMLIRASLGGHNETIELLLAQENSDVHYRDRSFNNRTALMAACCGSSKKTITLLLRQGATINQTDDNGDTPLTLACTHNSSDVVETLVVHGAIVDHTNLQGYSALMLACTEGNDEVVKLLLDYNADVTLRHPQHGTALDIAKVHGHTEVAALLEQHLREKAETKATFCPSAAALKHHSVFRLNPTVSSTLAASMSAEELEELYCIGGSIIYPTRITPPLSTLASNTSSEQDSDELPNDLIAGAMYPRASK